MRQAEVTCRAVKAYSLDLRRRGARGMGDRGGAGLNSQPGSSASGLEVTTLNELAPPGLWTPTRPGVG